MPTGSLVIGVALVVGVGGVFALFWAMNRVVDFLPGALRARACGRTSSSGPHVVMLAVFLVYPVINTIMHQLQGRATAKSWVGLDNYKFVFTDESMLRAIRNTAAVGRARAARRGERRARVRDAGRPAAPRRGDREVA